MPRWGDVAGPAPEALASARLRSPDGSPSGLRRRPIGDRACSLPLLRRGHGRRRHRHRGRERPPRPLLRPLPSAPASGGPSDWGPTLRQVTTATRLPPLSTVRWIAHAGLAAARPGGTPTHETLAAAVRLHVDWIELDVCVTADGRLVVRHDSCLPAGRRVEAVTRAELRRQGVDLLTLDEATDVLGRRVPIMLDIKGRGVTRPLGRWLARRRDPEAFVVCSGNGEDLLQLRRWARRRPRWR